MREQAMVANADRECSNQIKAEEEDEVDCARPKPETEQTKCVQRNDKKAVRPVKTRKFR